MLVGVFHFPTDYGIDISELARALEAARLRVAVRLRAHPHPGQPAHAVSGRRRAAQALFAHPRSVRRRCRSRPRRPTLKLGTGICLIPQRDPIITAKSVASLDQLSGGRFIFAIGGGWNVEEMENHGAKLRDPLQAAARARAGDEGAVDAGGGRVSRRVRQFRSRSGSTPSRSRSRIRRSSSAARATTP